MGPLPPLATCRSSGGGVGMWTAGEGLLNDAPTVGVPGRPGLLLVHCYQWEVAGRIPPGDCTSTLLLRAGGGEGGESRIKFHHCCWVEMPSNHPSSERTHDLPKKDRFEAPKFISNL